LVGSRQAVPERQSAQHRLADAESHFLGYQRIFGDCQAVAQPLYSGKGWPRVSGPNQIKIMPIT
jgi:hypothetical protein